VIVGIISRFYEGGAGFLFYFAINFLLFILPPTHERISGAIIIIMHIIIMHIIMQDAAWWVITHHPSSKNIGWG
jgi:hypothetical protein